MPQVIISALAREGINRCVNWLRESERPDLIPIALNKIADSIEHLAQERLSGVQIAPALNQYEVMIPWGKSGYQYVYTAATPALYVIVGFKHHYEADYF